MRTISSRALRYIRLNRKRTAATIVGIILSMVMLATVIKALPILINMRYSRMLDQMNCGVSIFDAKIEMICNDRGGLTVDGITIYKVSINDSCDLSLIDVSEWEDLPVDDNIVNYYMNGGQPMERYISNLENGNWRIAGKNKEDGVYGNIVLYVFDEDERCFYVYEWDS